MLIKWPPWYDNLILMFQKEVADRIVASKQTNDYGRLSILSNWRLEIKKHFNISKNCFFPKPKINSTLLSFKPKKTNQFNLKNPNNLRATHPEYPIKYGQKIYMQVEKLHPEPILRLVSAPKQNFQE